MTDKEIVIEHYGQELFIFYAEEMIALCNGAVTASFQNDPSATWQPFLKKAHQLLMLFAANGVVAAIDEAIKLNPKMSRKTFDNLLLRILNSKQK